MIGRKEGTGGFFDRLPILGRKQNKAQELVYEESVSSGTGWTVARPRPDEEEKFFVEQDSHVTFDDGNIIAFGDQDEWTDSIFRANPNHTLISVSRDRKNKGKVVFRIWGESGLFVERQLLQVCSITDDPSDHLTRGIVLFRNRKENLRRPLQVLPSTYEGKILVANASKVNPAELRRSEFET